MVVSCFVPWCVLACGAARVSCLACVWRALLARACCCAGAGTHPLSGGPVWLHGGPCWRPAAAQCAAVGCVYFAGGGDLVPLPSPSLPCPSVPFRRPALPAYPLRTRWVNLGWTVGLGGLMWCFSPAGRRGLGSFWGRVARVVCRAACTVSWASWLLFTSVHVLCVVLRVRCPGPLGSCSPVCKLCVWCCVYSALGPLAPVHRCVHSMCGGACTVSWASWLLFTGVHALCVVVRVRCPGPPGSCSPVCTLCVWCCVYGVLGLLAPVHRSVRSVCGVACTVSWASWLLFTAVYALCVVMRVRCPGPPGSCSPVCTLCVWSRVYGVLGLLAPVHRCARSVCGVACTVSWASWLLFEGVHALCVLLRVRCPGPPGSCSPVYTLCVRCCVHGAPGLLAPVHRCAVHALCVVLRVRRPGPPGSCSPVCTLCVWCCVYGVLGLLAPVHRFARSVCGVVCTVSWTSWLLFTGVHAPCVVWGVRRPGPLGSCSPVCTLCVWCCVYGVLGLLAPVHRSARSVCGGACTASWASWLLFTGVHALCMVVRVLCPGPPGSCSPVCTLCVWCCVYGVLGLLAPVHRCAHSVCGVACTASWASWLLFTGVHALRVVLRVRCSGPPGFCSPVCTLCVWCCVYGVLGLLAPVHRFARSVCGVVCAVSWAAWLRFTCVPALVVLCGVFWASWLLFTGVHALCGVACTVSSAPWLRFTGVHALCAALCVRCPGPLGSCSPVRVLVVLCRLCRVLGFLAPVLRRARSVCDVVCVVSWASLPFCADLLVWCVLCCVCGVLGHLVRVLRCRGVLRCVWCPVCGAACAVSWASRPLFTGAHARCVVLCGRCPGPLGSCSPACLCGVLCCVCGVLGHLAPVHRCARVACVVSRVRCPGPRGSRSPACRVLARCVVCCVRCPGPRGCCSPVCVLGVLRGVCGVGVGACARAPYRCCDVADSLFLFTHG